MGCDWYDIVSVAGMGVIFPTPKTMAVRHLLHTKYNDVCRFFRCEEKTVMLLKSTICASAKMNVCGPRYIEDPDATTCEMFKQLRISKRVMKKLKAEYSKLKSAIAQIDQLGLPAEEIADDLDFAVASMPVAPEYGFVMITAGSTAAFDMNRYSEIEEACEEDRTEYDVPYGGTDQLRVDSDEKDHDDDDDDDREDGDDDGGNLKGKGNAGGQAAAAADREFVKKRK